MSRLDRVRYDASRGLLGDTPFILHEIARHFRDVHNRVLLDLLVLDEVVELSGEHSLDKMFPIGHDNPISVDSSARIGVDEPDGEKLESVGGVKERSIPWRCVVQAQTTAGGELGHGCAVVAGGEKVGL